LGEAAHGSEAVADVHDGQRSGVHHVSRYPDVVEPPNMGRCVPDANLTTGG
jgi:hypothetical protein